MNTLTRLCRRHKTVFWGSEYFVTPRLVDWIHGDGLQVIRFTPLATRPDYYVVRIDSKIDLDNCGKGPCFCDEVLDDLQDEIENQFLPHREEWTNEKGRTYVKHWPFPAFDGSCGTAWCGLATLKQADRRTDHRIRQDLNRAGARPKPH